MATAIWGSSLYTIVDGTSWEQASANSIDLGGYLLTINSFEEDVFVWNNYKYQDLSIDGYNWGYWIGLRRDPGSDFMSSDSWYWSSGEELNYLNQSFNPEDSGTEPNGGSGDLYTHIWGYNEGIHEEPLWNDVTNIGNPGTRSSAQVGVAEIPLYLTTTLPLELNEGEAFLLDINLTAGSTGTTYTEGQTIWYQIDGVQESDFTNDVSLSGWGVIAESGNIILDGATEEGIALNLAADSEDEGEALSISFYSADPDLSVYEPENLVVNGDFEADVLFNGRRDQFTPEGWTLDYGGGVDVFASLGGYASPVDGQFVQLEGRDSSSITQNLSTTAGFEYNLSFDWLPQVAYLEVFGEEPSFWGGDAFEVLIGGDVAFMYHGSYEFQSEVWRTETISFVAESSLTEITLRAPYGEGNAAGANLDNVSVTLSHGSYLDMIQIGETVSAEVIDAVDPITGTLGLPGKVNLKSQGKVPFRLYGSEDIDVNAIDLDSILFGGDPEALMADAPFADAYFQGAQRTQGKKVDSYIANITDINGDGFDDITIKAPSNGLMGVMEKGDTEIYAYAQMGEESVLWSKTDAVFF